MASVVLLGTLDTKGAEYEFLRDRVRDFGCDVILVDAGVMSDLVRGGRHRRRGGRRRRRGPCRARRRARPRTGGRSR